MRALILSWEYPPLIEGGLARHVRKLAENLAAQDVDVHVLARGRNDDPSEEEAGGVVIHRVREPGGPGRWVSRVVLASEDPRLNLHLLAGLEPGVFDPSSAVMIRDPRLKSPYSAVLEMLYLM